MEISQEELQEFIDELETDADEIENDIENFCGGIFATTTLTEANVKRKQWRTPEEETKEFQREARSGYEVWYTSARNLIQEYIPERLDTFEKEYEEFKRHISLEASPDIGHDGLYNHLIDAFDEQRNSLNAIPAKIKTEQFKTRRQISSRMVRDEIQRARELFNEDFIRASGVIAAVALERHLLTMCENSEQVTEYEANHGINRLAQTLYESNVIDKTIWNDLKALASIRETCAHPEEPKKEAVRRLINDTEEFVRANRS